MFINLNGQLLPADKPSLTQSNRSFRYGDSLFESLKMIHGKILFLQDHLNRVLEGAVILGMLPRGGKIQASKMLEQEIKRLLQQENQILHCRLRLTIFRSDGGLYEPRGTGFGFLIETFATVLGTYTLNAKGLVVDIYEDMHKNSDLISNYKTGNSLVYVMAALHKKNKGLDDCIVLNTSGRPVEFTSSNLFIISKGIVITPALTEGCISGVMRKNLLEFLQKEGYETRMENLEIESLENADEMFRCNMGHGIQWVGKFREKIYQAKETQEIFSRFQVHLDSLLYFPF